MNAIVHQELGNLSPTISTIAPFNPLNWMLCPGNLKKLQRVAKRKYCRDNGEMLGTLPRKIRAAAIEQAADACVCRFLDADYAKAGITDDEPARAVLYAVAYVRRAGWRYGATGSERRDNRKGTPYIGSMGARGDNPATIAATIETAGRYKRYGGALQGELAENRARAALTGEVRERKTGGTVHCPGGKAYGETRKMISTEIRGTYVDGCGVQDWGGVQIPFRYALATYPGGWKMESKKAHKPTEYPAGDVPETVDVGPEPGTFIPPPVPTTGIPPTPGTELTRRPIRPDTLERIAAGN